MKKAAWRFLAAALAATAAAGLAGPTAAEESVVVSSYGGKFTDALRTAIYKPFEQATGIRIIESIGVTLPRVKAMVVTGNVEVDVLELVPSELLVLSGQGMLQKLDTSLIDKTTLGQFDPNDVTPNGIAFLYYSQVIAYNTKTYDEKNHPRTWAEFWDAQKFAGNRIFPMGDYTWSSPIEAALVADGVPPDHLYPLDLERAYKSLARLKPSVVKWINSASATPQALVDGEAVLGFANSSRMIELRRQGAPVDFEWNQGFVTHDFLAIPKGAKQFANAMKFIAFSSQAKIQADVARLMPYGPSNRAAIDLLSPSERAELASAPDNLKKQIFTDAAWWAEKDSAGKSNLERNAALWSSWSQSQ